MSANFPAGEPVTVITNVLQLRGSPMEFAKETAWQIIAALELTGFQIVPIAKPDGAEVRQ